MSNQLQNNMQAQPVDQQQHAQDVMIQLQGSLVNKLIKRIFPDKVVTSDFKKQFSKLLTLFIFYVQSGQQKKKYGESQILAFLEQEGLGQVADDLRNRTKSKYQELPDKKKIPQQVNMGEEKRQALKCINQRRAQEIVELNN